nr:dynein axonemal heavy chain 2 [Nothobranchius furzeri]
MDEDYLKTIRQLLVQRVYLSGAPEESWTEDTMKLLDPFILDTSVSDVMVYLHPLRGIQVVYQRPSEVEELFQFTRLKGAIITEETFDAVISFQIVRGNSLHKLLQAMSGFHMPLFSHNSYKAMIWKDEYIEDIYYFITFLTEDVYKEEGRIILLIPVEVLQCSVEEARRDKSLIKRMEILMIHWTDQIRDLLNEDETDSCGLLQQIEFWAVRSTKLSEIHQQLEKPEVRHIQNILQQTKSLYLENFIRLQEELKAYRQQAESNRKFLSILKVPCEGLSKLSPREMASKLEHIISLIHIIWANSPYYKDKDRITRLFCQMNYELIHLCTQNISLDKIFGSSLLSSKQVLNDCVYCCLSWKDTYQHVSERLQKISDSFCSLDTSRFFVVTDAFIKRLTDLLEVCLCQYQFSHGEERQQREVLYFRGTRGPELTRRLQDIEAKFHTALQTLRTFDESIFDVSDSTWSNEFSSFSSFVKELEIMVKDLITSAFGSINTIQDGIRLMDIFQHMATRETIRVSLEEEAEKVVSLFNDELQSVNRAMNQEEWPFPDHIPKIVGQALWAKACKHKLTESMEALQSSHYLVNSHSYNQVLAAHSRLNHELEEVVKEKFLEWVQELDERFFKKLEQPLLLRQKSSPSKLDINFDYDPLSLFSEIRCWEQLNCEIPQSVSDIQKNGEGIRILRERALVLVRSYNRIFERLSPNELGLFRDQVRVVDRAVEPGRSKLLFVNKGASEIFIRDCLRRVEKLHSLVDRYKISSQLISNLCQLISETLLLKIDAETAYRNLEFEQTQKAHQMDCLQKLRSAHQEIVRNMTEIHSIFAKDGAEVQENWASYTSKVDHMVEEAFRLNISNSMNKLSTAINGNQNPGAALFEITINLQQTSPQTFPKVTFSPSLKKLAEMVNILPQLIRAISEFKRLPGLLSLPGSQENPIFRSIGQDEKIRESQAAIMAGMSANAICMEEYKKTWYKYRDIWGMNKDNIINNYKRQNPPLSSIDADIQRYSEKANSVDQEKACSCIQFVRVDCSPLKLSLVEHCREWKAKLTELLSQEACSRLQELYSTIQDNADRLKQTPETLADLDKSFTLLNTLRANSDKTFTQVSVIQEQFAVLQKYEVPVEDSVMKMRDGLNDQWDLFQSVLKDSSSSLHKHKENFKQKLDQSYELFKNKVEATVHEFNSKGPFDSELGPDLALCQIAEHCVQLEMLKQEQDTIFEKLDFFKIKQTLSRSIQTLEKELGQLQKVWEITKEWNNNWNSWKVVQLSELQVDRMESTAQEMSHELNVLHKDLKDKKWKILDYSTSLIQQFKKRIPLITDLRNQAMRDRHWKQIYTKPDHHFDPTSADFTLEKLLSLGLDQSMDRISEISAAASKELLLEQDLEGIRKTWEGLYLDIQPYNKEDHFWLRCTEDIFQAVDDSLVVLSTLKASRFVKIFEQEVDQWEGRVSHVQEVVEMILTVQRNWIYLENIFSGIEKGNQLPHGYKKFKGVSASWKTVMSHLQKERNALQGTHHPGLLDSLSDMNTCLEEILKSLDVYLETKRQIFPRFYFMSNDDMLKILGLSKNPKAMQPHMEKCFGSIKSLKLDKRENKPLATGMISADGEITAFIIPVELDKAVEVWLCDVDQAVSTTLKAHLNSCCSDLRKLKGQRNKWITAWLGQITVTASLIKWTSDVTKCLATSSLKQLKKKQAEVLQSYSEMMRENLTRVVRLKTAALVSVEVHARDVTDKLLKAGCCDADAFEWLCQLRLYLESSTSNLNECCIRQMQSQFKYGYKYLVNTGCLVITPLTDRCYLTLTTALHLHRGGCLKGPAGTGKTETVKELGKTLGVNVIVVNCSKEQDCRSMGRVFSGLAQLGAWGCFDELNRTSVEVLSVVAHQILSIQSALEARQSDFLFEGNKIRLVPSCGIFVTMDTGFAGRSELPDNLKLLFRPVSMVTPDSASIAEVLLFAAGFKNCKSLARKAVTLNSLMVQQLSQQDHYDFSLRSLTSMLRHAEKKRHSFLDLPDEEILLTAIKDMNIPKLTSADLPLFSGLIQDLFPAASTPMVNDSVLKEAIELELRQSSLQVTQFTVTKVMQLYETKASRRSCMLVGQTGSGKSVTWRTLQNVLTALQQQGKPGFQLVQMCPLNPKSLSLSELYGERDISTNEWTDGVLSSLMRAFCADEKPDEKWIVFDGPVDTQWVESMNSVMDDNMVLMLINGERILVPEQVSLLFEVENLALASPATVSRCGVVYCDSAALGWRPFVSSWLEKRHKAEVEHLKTLFDKYIESTLSFKRTNCRELIPISDLNGVTSLCHLYDSLATSSSELGSSDMTELGKVVELWFVFSLIWSIGASVDKDGRRKINNFLREMGGSFPQKDTIYEYYVNPDTKTWVPFEYELPLRWNYDPTAPFYEIMVPTVDTVRYNLLVNALVSSQYPVLLTGPVGTGKTSLAQSVLQGLGDKWTSLTVNMNSQTTSNDIQTIIQTRTEQKTKGVFLPAGGKQLLCFLDDLNLPAPDPFGSQPPLELLRFWTDYGFWYNQQKLNRQFVNNMLLMGSMAPPGGGRTRISARFQSRFNLINMAFPEESQVRSIFSTMINQRLQNFEEDMRPMGDTVTEATLKLYNAVAGTFLPSPANTHYQFSLRDISKVFQGLLRAHPECQDTKEHFTRLWIHECYRVFSDRLVNQEDMNTFTGLVEDTLRSLFTLSLKHIWPNKQSPIFGDFLRGSYEEIQDMDDLKMFLKDKLKEYNKTSGSAPMNLVFFQDAIKHITRVLHAISQLRGNMLLIGVGGSGRKSLSKMAAFICGYQVFQVEVTKRYCRQEFREDVKKLYRLTGVDNKPTVLLLNDLHNIDESILGDINNILSSGEVPDLYKQEEFAEVCRALSEFAREDNIPETPDSLFSYLMGRVRNNLHTVLCMSPGGGAFRKRLLQYPAIVSCTSMDWFGEWPKEALLEVAERRLDGLDLGSGREIHRKVASFFETLHQSVQQVSHRMEMEMKRCRYYVTPTSFLQLVAGYRKLLAEKRAELEEQVNKLRNGLIKIREIRENAEVMSVELETAKRQAVEFQRECDQFLEVIAQQQKEASRQQKTVGVHREKTKKEELQCKIMANNAQAELDKAMPALEEAMKALESLNKKDMIEIKTYGHPPALVEMVMQAVMILLGKEPSWAEAKKQLGDSNFIKTVINFDKNNVPDRVLKRIGQYCRHADFQPGIIGKVSLAAKSLCMWVRAIEMYGRVYKEVEPKRAQLNAALSQLADKQEALSQAQSKLQEVGEKLARLQLEHAEKLEMKDSLRKKLEEMEMKLDRADKLVSGLAEERVCWEERVAGLEENMGHLMGDCLLAASFLSCMGPFLPVYRDELLSIWKKKLVDLEIQFSPGFRLTDFLSKSALVRDWNVQGLLSDVFSTENGLIITHGNRWPLIVDPQGQAVEWIQHLEKEKGLKVIDNQTPDYLQVLEKAVQAGKPVLLQNVQENLDPSLNPVLNKPMTGKGGRFLMKLGDKEVDYNPEFRFYITTKMSNPHYPPEICSKTTIIYFGIQEQGLEARLLGIVVRNEQPGLEEQKDNLAFNIPNDTKRLQDLNDQILSLLNEASGSLLEDPQLINTLHSCRAAAKQVSEQLEGSKRSILQVDSAREAYRPCVRRASILFFIMTSMTLIDPMYQFSLDAYISLFARSVESSKGDSRLEARISNINDHHTYAVYRYTCRALFEAHKLVFTFQMCTRLLTEAGELHADEFSFFLRGGNVEKRDGTRNPCVNWLPDSSWDNITALTNLQKFKDMGTSLEQNPEDWKSWLTQAEPEKTPLPGGWSITCDDLQKMLIVRSLRPDRVASCITSFVVKHLGPRFVEPPVLNMKAALEESSSWTPLIFVLSPGADPTDALLQLAKASGMSRHLHTLYLGQGQALVAKRMVEEGVKEGHWVFLANCHLSLAWTSELDRLIQQLRVQKPHPHFRLWLSTSPYPEFPVGILQAGIKMTVEPPQGLKASMKHLYQLVTPSHPRPGLYNRLLFSLCSLHSVLLERRKFQPTGWNVIYGFGDSDFKVSESLLRLFLDSCSDIPFNALQNVIADVGYGGHVTDDWDQRLLTTTIRDYLNEAGVNQPGFRFCSPPPHPIPPDSPLSAYEDYISTLPPTDRPEVLGLHPNADIPIQLTETRTLFHSLLSLQPAAAAEGGDSREDRVLALLGDVRAQIPGQIDTDRIRSFIQENPSPLDLVLLQETLTYNRLLETVSSTLVELERGIRDLVVMSPTTEETLNCIYHARVPPLWQEAYPSLKPLAAWTQDLHQRVDQLSRWAENIKPPVSFWLSGFSRPNSFLTAVLQTTARQNKISMDTLSWEFIVSTLDDISLVDPPKVGVYIRGLYLEGAGWDVSNSCLVEAEPMQMFCPIPTIHFRPVENHKKKSRSVYLCPCYYYPVRAGRAGREASVVSIELKSGAVTPDHWIRRGTALLMSLEN